MPLIKLCIQKTRVLAKLFPFLLHPRAGSSTPARPPPPRAPSHPSWSPVSATALQRIAAAAGGDDDIFSRSPLTAPPSPATAAAAAEAGPPAPRPPSPTAASQAPAQRGPPGRCLSPERHLAATGRAPRRAGPQAAVGWPSPLPKCRPPSLETPGVSRWQWGIGGVRRCQPGQRSPLQVRSHHSAACAAPCL